MEKIAQRRRERKEKFETITFSEMQISNLTRNEPFTSLASLRAKNIEENRAETQSIQRKIKSKLLLVNSQYNLYHMINPLRS